MNNQTTCTCPLCGRSAHSIADAVPGYQEGRTYTICECEECLASFAIPMMCDDSLYNCIYANARYVPGYNRYYRYASEVISQRRPLEYLSRQEETYWAVARHLGKKKHEKDRLNILEIGCGMGYFTYAVAKAGFTITGVDISRKAIDWAREHYGPYYACKTLLDLKSENARYDLIIMNQSVEHCPDVHAFISEALDLLSSEGELIITTPNKSTFPDSKWGSDMQPVHLWWFGEEAMRYIAQRHKCRIALMDFEPFYKDHVSIKTPNATICDYKPVFDATGALLVHHALPPVRPVRRMLEQTGGLMVLRRIRAVLAGKDRWRGSRGPIIAAVLRRAGS